MNTFQLIKSLKSDKFTKKSFIGVFARDEIPLKIKYPSCFIINNKKRSHPGEHWLALFIDGDGSVDFFDSMGFHPSFYGLEDKLKQISKNIIRFSSMRVQGFFSNYCGVYCLLFLYKRSRGIKFKEFLKYFKNCNQNDLFIKQKIKNLL